MRETVSVVRGASYGLDLDIETSTFEKDIQFL